MTRILPPLNALRAFEAAGRNLSFTKAAAELSVTPAAVSHQIKALEELIGASLFRRVTRALRLTEAGQAALPLLSQGFDSLAKGTEQMRAHCQTGMLTISVSPSFGAMWLVPRLEKFRARHPDIEIRIDGTDRLVDLAMDDADVAIRYGPEGHDRARVDFLFGQVNTPVCSPMLLSGDHPLKAPGDLRHHTLLHVDWKEAEPSWRMWLLAADTHGIDPSRGPRFSQINMAVQAALDGHGVALVGHRLVSDHLASGRLVRPFAPGFNTPLNFAYRLLTPKDNTEQPKIAAFRDWLLEEAGTARG